MFREIFVPEIFRAFESACAGLGAVGSVLEVGATHSPHTLLQLSALAGCRERVGLNPGAGGERRGVHIVRGHPNRMTMFEDGRFDLVVSHATFEHDPCFWESVAEMRRVTRPGGHMILATVASEAPGGPEFYRFGEAAFPQVFFRGWEDLYVTAVPPLLLGRARKPSLEATNNEAFAVAAAMDAPGDVTAREASVLWSLARQVERGVIVDVGSVRGRRPVALALGARAGRRAPVYAVEPERGAHRAALAEDLLRAGVAGDVRTLALPAARAAAAIPADVALLVLEGEGAADQLAAWDGSVPPGAAIVLLGARRARALVHDRVGCGAWSPVGQVGDAIVVMRLG